MVRWLGLGMAVALAGCVATPSERDPFGPSSVGGTQPGGSDTETEGEAGTDGEDTDGSTGADADTGEVDTTGEPLPPFSCDPVAATSPVLDGLVLFEPAQPHPGDTLTVVVRATNGTSRADAPPMDLEVTDRNGIHMVSTQTIEGGEALYYYAIPDVPEGELCLRGIIGGATEVSGSVEVSPRPPGPPIDGGIFKITSNHMWTCDEEPDWGNELHVWVRDENGQGLGGVPVTLRVADTTDLASIYNGGREPLPSEIVTGDDGHAMAYNYWPISDNGLLVFEVEVAGVASDVATEITTGWWEDDLMGCNYCNTPLVNVWGHWSYTVEFQRTPSATEACVVPNDHAGMTACGPPRHIHHHPDATSCWTP